MSKESELPTPYGDGSIYGAGNQNSLYRRVKARDTGRKLWTRIASYRILQQIRISLTFIAPIYATLNYFDVSGTNINISIFLFILIFILFIPSFLAIIFAQMFVRD